MQYTNSCRFKKSDTFLRAEITLAPAICNCTSIFHRRRLNFLMNNHNIELSQSTVLSIVTRWHIMILHILVWALACCFTTPGTTVLTWTSTVGHMAVEPQSFPHMLCMLEWSLSQGDIKCWMMKILNARRILLHWYMSYKFHSNFKPTWIFVDSGCAIQMMLMNGTGALFQSLLKQIKHNLNLMQTKVVPYDWSATSNRS